MNLLRQALSQRRRNVQISAEIEEGKPLSEILPESIKNDVELDLDSRWWLERFFIRHNLSFAQGALLVYLIKIVPSVVLLLFLVGQTGANLLSANISSFFGDLFIPISLILIYSIYKSLVKLRKTMNEDLKENTFAAPPILITEKELKSSKALHQLDKDYSNRYIKPVMLRTLQSGLNITFNRNYQIGSGMIAATLFLLLMFLRFVVNVMPPGFFNLTDYGASNINAAAFGVTMYALSIDWFLIGMLTWTLFTTFLCVIQASGNPIRAHPFELIKERFAPVSTLILKTSFTVTFVVAWASPFLLLWSILPPDPVTRQGVLYFVESIVAVMIPVILLSFFFPILKVHKGLTESRYRLLLLKGYQLQAIKERPARALKTDEYLRIRRHLILDYKDVQENSVWMFDFRHVLQMIGSVLLPIVTFWLSTQLR